MKRPDCPQCGIRYADLKAAKQAKWTAALCPRCINAWAAPTATASTTPRCAGCGRRASLSNDNLCRACTDAGVQAPTLFEVSP